MAAKKRTKILRYVLAALALPPLLAFEASMELLEFGEEMSLLMTGGKYSGKGSLSRGKSRDTSYWPKFWNWLLPPDYDSDNFDIALRRFERQKFLEKRVSDQGTAEIVLTESGKDRVMQTFPLFRLANKPWKGWWLVVTFDIPESKRKTRDLIRQQLISLGFARWQKSVYVSPHDIADDLSKMLREYNLGKIVVPMIAKKILSGGDWEFAQKLFGVDKISMDYGKIITDLKKFNGSPNRFRQIFAAYLETLIRDPFLPVGLAPKEGYGREMVFSAIRETAAKFRLKLRK